MKSSHYRYAKVHLYPSLYVDKDIIDYLEGDPNTSFIKHLLALGIAIHAASPQKLNDDNFRIEKDLPYSSIRIGIGKDVLSDHIISSIRSMPGTSVKNYRVALVTGWLFHKHPSFTNHEIWSSINHQESVTTIPFLPQETLFTPDDSAFLHDDIDEALIDKSE